MVQYSLEDLFPLEDYTKYRRHTRKMEYCDPLVPVVGDRYGNGDLIKFVYSGVAGGWAKHIRASGNAETVRRESRNSCSVQDTNGSAFWRLFDDALALIDDSKKLDEVERRECAVLTNLSKTGGVRQTAVGENDLKLHCLDVRQFRREIDLLDPDLLLCVSGGSLPQTGHCIFDGWPASKEVSSPDPETSIKRMPNGGWLYWTMHPQGKSAAWTRAVLAEVGEVIKRVRGDARN